jgi:hypothetical protein
VKICHVLTLQTHTNNKILTLCIIIINKFHHNNIIHHNRILILIATHKSLPLVPDKVRPHFRQVLNICQVLIKYLSSSQYNTDTTTSGGLPPLHPTGAGCSTPTPHSSVPESPIESGAEKRRKRVPPSYDVPWWRYYEQTLGPDDVLINVRCKVSNCKTSYIYVIKNSLSQFKKHADKYINKK